MPRMIDLIRQSAVPANTVRAASKGALELPAGEMLEILVYLTTNPVFAEQARMTLAGWDEKACREVLASPQTSWEVLTYFLAAENRRPKLLPALLDNSSIREASLMELAQADSREVVDTMLASSRVRRSPDLLHALAANPHLTPEEASEIERILREGGADTAVIEAIMEEAPPAEEKSQFELDNAAAIAAEEAAAKPFELVGGMQEELPLAEEVPHTQAVPEAAAQAAESTTASAAAAGVAKAEPDVRERLSTLQKIARLTVGQRIQLGMKGNKEERFILIRDGSKLVSVAVLQSPKLSDQEVEMFAAMKNVQEGVLREIARSHKYLKNYGVIRQLVNNPRTPLDLSLGLMNHLLINDLRSLSANKNVSDTVRKMATKRYKEKTEKKKPGE